MPRLRERHWRYERTAGAVIALLLGPSEGLSVEELEVAWQVERERLLGPPRQPGSRPWAYWFFELGEEPPRATWNADTRRMENADGETLRLAELRLLEADELAALAERAHEAGLRIGTPAERFSGGGRETGVPVDVQAVELWDAVRERLP